MNQDNIDTIIAALIVLIFFIVLFGIMFLGIKIENDFELKKLGIIKTKNKVITTNPDYNEKLKYQLKSSLITIGTVLIILIICKLFGFNVKDIKDLF